MGIEPCAAKCLETERGANVLVLAGDVFSPPVVVWPTWTLRQRSRARFCTLSNSLMVVSRPMGGGLTAEVTHERIDNALYIESCVWNSCDRCKWHSWAVEVRLGAAMTTHGAQQQIVWKKCIIARNSDTLPEPYPRRPVRLVLRYPLFITRTLFCNRRSSSKRLINSGLNCIIPFNCFNQWILLA